MHLYIYICFVSAWQCRPTNFLPKDSAEYKEVFNLAKDWVQEFKSEYKKAMKLQNEVLISKRQSEKIANSTL